MTPLLAHQGNWDEALMFIIPIALAVGAVKYAERRADKKRAEEEIGETVEDAS